MQLIVSVIVAALVFFIPGGLFVFAVAYALKTHKKKDDNNSV